VAGRASGLQKWEVGAGGHWLKGKERKGKEKKGRVFI